MPVRRLLVALLAVACAVAALASSAFATTTGGVAAPSGSPTATSGGATPSATPTERRSPRKPPKPKKRKPKRPQPKQPEPKKPAASHRFPVAGPHTFGGEGAQFGAPRDGGKRKHQGQDIIAAEGLPIVAPRGGTVKFVGDQPGGAGIYVVLDSATERFDYVFMHIQEGSLLVALGQRVRTGQRIASVGQTGAAEGPHLHFEMWLGPWQAGGTAVDPLPYLLRWDKRS
ncbi:MAG TPA: M23 family metallopeptidase [Thermoleophilaceae bacterium]